MHGWSPDGKYLVFCDREIREYTFTAFLRRRPRKKLTNTPGLDDGRNIHPMESISILILYAGGLMAGMAA